MCPCIYICVILVIISGAVNKEIERLLEFEKMLLNISVVKLPYLSLTEPGFILVLCTAPSRYTVVDSEGLIKPRCCLDMYVC